MPVSETAPIKSLELQVKANADKAASSLDLLAEKLERVAGILDSVSSLTGSIGKIGDISKNFKSLTSEVDKASKNIDKVNKKAIKPKMDTASVAKMNDMFNQIRDRMQLSDFVGGDRMATQAQQYVKMLPALPTSYTDYIKMLPALYQEQLPALNNVRAYSELIGEEWRHNAEKVRAFQDYLAGVVQQQMASSKMNLPATASSFTDFIKFLPAVQSATDYSRIIDVEWREIAEHTQEFNDAIDEAFEKYAGLGSDVDLASDESGLLTQIRDFEDAIDDAMSVARGFGDTSSAEFQEAAQDVVWYTNALEAAREALERLPKAVPKASSLGAKGNALDMDTTNPSRSNASYEQERMANAMKAFGSYSGDAESSEKKLADAAEDVADKTEEASDSAMKLGKRAKSSLNVFKELSKAAKFVGSALKGIPKAFGQGVSLAKSFGSAIRHPVASLTNLFGISKGKGLFAQIFGGGRTFGQFVGMMALRKVINGLFSSLSSAAREGSENLVQYSSQYNASISAMVSSLLYLKNAWAAAFAPIVNVVAPYISAFIDMLASAMNAIGRFLAALTGKGFAVQAKKNFGSVAADLAGAGGAASGAKDAMEEYKKTILSFDELHVLNAPNEDSSGGSGGGGGGGIGDIDPSDMFTTVTTTDAVSNFGKALREAILKEDWDSVGRLLAEKINGIFEKIDKAISWDNVGTKITKFTTGVTQSFNSLVRNINWGQIGKTVGDGVNTVTRTLNQLYDGVDWSQLGRKLSEGVNKFVGTVNWAEVGRLLGQKARTIYTTLYSFVSGTDWDNVASAFKTTVKNIFDWNNLGKEIAGSFNLLVDVIDSFINPDDFGDLGETIGTIISDAIGGIDWEKFGSTLAEVPNSLFTFVKKIFQTIEWKDLGSSIKTGLKSFFENINWTEFGAAVKEALEGLLDLMIGVMPDFDEVGETIIDGIIDAVGGFTDADVSKLGAKLGLFLVKAAKNALTVTNPFGATLGNMIEKFTGTDPFEGALDFTFGPIEDSLEDVAYGSKKATDSITTSEKKAAKNTQKTGGLLSRVLNIFKKDSNTTTETVVENNNKQSTSTQKTGGILSKVWNGVSSLLGGAKNDYNSLSRTAESSLRNGEQAHLRLQNTAAQSGKAMSDTMQNTLTGLSNFGTKVKSVVDTIANNVKSSAETGTSGASSAFTTYTSKVNALFAEAQKDAKTNGSNWVKALQTGMEDQKKNLNTAAKGVRNDSVAQFEDKDGVAKGHGKSTAVGYKTGFEGFTDTIKATITGIKTGAIANFKSSEQDKTNVKSHGNTLTDFFNKGINLLKDTVKSSTVGLADTAASNFASSTANSTAYSAGQALIQSYNNGVRSVTPAKLAAQVDYTNINGTLVPTTVTPQVMASGGFLDFGEIFIAREAGPEMVGSFGSHKNAVANNAQIIEGIEAGVARGMAQALMASGGNSAPFVINLNVRTEDDEVLFRAVERGKAKRNFRFNPATVS